MSVEKLDQETYKQFKQAVETYDLAAGSHEHMVELLNESERKLKTAESEVSKVYKNFGEFLPAEFERHGRIFTVTYDKDSKEYSVKSRDVVGMYQLNPNDDEEVSA